MSEQWKKEWQPVVGAVGQDFGDQVLLFGADGVELAVIRRYLEPLEFDCPLHYDRTTARNAGYRDVIAPWSALSVFTARPLWSPGDPPIFTNSHYDFQPAGVGGFSLTIAPPTVGLLGTDLAVEYFEPVVLGDRIARFGRRLVSCHPKDTRIGRGAFLKWESEFRNQDKVLVARMTTGTYIYNPHE